MIEFQTFERHDGKWDYRIVETGNHETLAQSSQGFDSEIDTHRAIINLAEEITIILEQQAQDHMPLPIVRALD